MAKANQGYRRDLDLEETPNDFDAFDNIGGVGISFDLQIIQNNLRNISTAGFSTLTDGFFDFGTTSNFVFTDDDPIKFGTSVSFGVTTFNTTDNFFVCNSNGENKFKLSTTSSTSDTGISTISITGTASINTFNFIRSDAVTKDNVLNLIDPVSLQDDDFQTIRNVESPRILNGFELVQENIENAKFFISRKYRGNVDTTADTDIKVEGVVKVNDPVNFNDSVSDLGDTKSPGVFINNTRAFSSDNNPWEELGSADGTGTLSTDSLEVSVAELSLVNSISIGGTSTNSETSSSVNSYTHKLPVVINGETYSLLLKQ
tara:strand:+ start:1027 stop:1974 length:948 start_codon:yes stop_codon:yes gene_type:complete